MSLPTVPVERTDYPTGDAGPALTIEKVVKRIHEGRSDPLARQIAEGIVREAGYAPRDRVTNRQAAEAIHTYVLSKVRYRPDPPKTELLQKPTITLCVPGAAACIPIGDCDDGTATLGWLYVAYGMPVRLVIQHWAAENTDHVFIEVQDDDGSWWPADFSNFNVDGHPFGWKPRADSEYRIDPFEPANAANVGARSAEYVGIGKAKTVAMMPQGRLQPKMVGLGAAADPFADAASMLSAQVLSQVSAGDGYLAGGDAARAVAAYQAGGQAGADRVGPAIDRAGQSSITQPLTQRAWLLNGKLASLGANIGDATLAQGLAYQMAALYQQAITTGRQAAGVGGPSNALVNLGIGLTLLGGGLWAWKHLVQPRRRGR